MAGKPASHADIISISNGYIMPISITYCKKLQRNRVQNYKNILIYAKKTSKNYGVSVRKRQN